MIKILTPQVWGFLRPVVPQHQGFFIKNKDFLRKKVTISKKPHTLRRSNRKPNMYHVYTLLCPNIHIMLI